MFGCIDCCDRGDLDAIKSGVSFNCNVSWIEGLEICLVLKPRSRFSFLLVDLGTGGLDLLVDEEVECDSSLVSGGRGEAGIFCDGEDMRLSQ
jgi:hypothetical protein